MKQEHNFIGKKSLKPDYKKGTQFAFRVAHLKGIVESFLNRNLKNEYKRPLLLAVIVSTCDAEVSDGFTSIPAKFTDKSMSALHSIE